MERSWAEVEAGIAGRRKVSALVVNHGLGTAYQVDQFPGADFGAKLQACLGTVSATYGGTCDARNFTGNAVDGIEPDDIDSECDGAAAVRDDFDGQPGDCDGGNEECDAARLRLAGSQHGEREPGRNGVFILGDGRDGAGGRPDVCGGYDGFSSGQRGDQYDDRGAAQQRRDWRLIARRRWIWRACIFWVTRTRRA